MTESIHVQRIFYGDNESQFGDLRLPQTEGPYPVAIVIHGGFWRANVNLHRMDLAACDLTMRGFATWNIEYRRVGQEGGGWPETFIDAANAADYLQTLAKSFPLDLQRVLTVGFSAGGQLAAWLAGRRQLADSSPIKTTTQPLSIYAAISLAGVLDMSLMEEVLHLRGVRQKETYNPVFDLLNGRPDQVPDRYAEASPIQLLPLGIKQLLAHGSLDINVPIGISLNYKKAAEQAGDDVVMLELPFAEHFKLIDPDLEAWPVIAEEIMKLIE